MGVLGVDCITESLTDATSIFGAGIKRTLLLPDDCRECAGGVGGRRGAPILFEVCFNIRGFELSELGTDGVLESALLSRVAKV